MHLLDVIASAAGCQYLSDLHEYKAQHTAALLFHHIRKIPVRRFSVQQWQEAFTYITGNPCDVCSAKACKRALLTALLSFL